MPALQKFKNILVHEDASEQASFALRRAAKLATRNDASLTIVDVVNTPSAFMSQLVPRMDSLVNEDIASRDERLEQLAEPFRNDGLSVSTKVLRGRPLLELIREVDAGKHDLLMKDANADTDDLFFGSLDMRLLRYCPIPLWLTKPDAAETPKRILVAIDPISVAEELRLNESIMQMASLLAYRDGVELHVVSVWHQPFDAMCSQDEYQQRYEQCIKEVEAAARDNVNRVLRSSVISVREENKHICAGVINDEIVKVVAEVSPDLLVMGTLARCGLTGILIGNTAEKVLRRVECSVLTVKPHDFVSPISEH